MAPWLVSTTCPARSTRHRAWGQVRLSTLRYSRAKICGLSRYANLEIRITRCLLPSVVKDRSFRSRGPDRNVSAPGGVRIRLWSRSRKKKPGNERRACPSILGGCFYPRSLRNGYARFSFCSNPVLVTNFTSGSAAYPVCQDNPRQIRGTPTSGEYSKERN
jgi:hypothetical protein